MPRAKHSTVKRQALFSYLTRNRIKKQEFAKMVGVSPETVSIWLYTNTMPKYQTLLRLARCLGLSVGEVADLFDTADNEQKDKIPTLADVDNA